MSKPAKAIDGSHSKKQKNMLPGAASPAPASSMSSIKSKTKSLIANQLHPLEVLLGLVIKHSDGTTISPKELAVEGGVIGLYFAAHWCPPCKLMSAQLALMYDEMKRNHKTFEVVFISFDYSLESYSQYLSKMPWYAIDYSETDKREEIAELFHIRGIPVLILLEAETGQVIALNGREILNMDPLGKKFPWKLSRNGTSIDSMVLPQAPSISGQNVGKSKTQTLSAKSSETENKTIDNKSIDSKTVESNISPTGGDVSKD